MLIPKFSLRTMLIATAVCAVLSLVLAQAVRGETKTAAAFLFGLGSIGLAFVLYFWTFAMAFLVAWLVRSISEPWKAPVVSSPFSDAGPPKQIITPAEPE